MYINVYIYIHTYIYIYTYIYHTYVYLYEHVYKGICTVEYLAFPFPHLLYTWVSFAWCCRNASTCSRVLKSLIGERSANDISSHFAGGLYTRAGAPEIWSVFGLSWRVTLNCFLPTGWNCRSSCHLPCVHATHIDTCTDYVCVDRYMFSV